MDYKNNDFFLAALIDIGAIITVLAALMYTAGWSYAYHYFSRFHLGLLGLEIKREYFFLYGFWVLKDKWPYVLVCLLGTAGLAIFLRYLSQGAADIGQGGGAAELYAGAKRRDMPPAWRQPVVWVAAPAHLFLLFVIFYQLGVETGYARYKSQLDDDFRSYPRVKVWLATEKSEATTKEEKAWAEQQRQDLAGGCYRLLLRNKDQIYLFYADGARAHNDREPGIPTEIIPGNRVTALRALPLYQSSEECR